MIINNPITDYIKKSILTNEGDLVVRGATSPQRLDAVSSGRPFLSKGNNTIPGYEKFPSFSVHRDGVDQAIPSITYTKVEWSTEIFDTNNDFDIATNYRFTPSIAGKYFLGASCWFSILADTKQFLIQLRKNGVVLHETNKYSSYQNGLSVGISAIVDANGAGDYFEVYLFQDEVISRNLNGTASVSYFTGSRIS